MKLQYSKYDRVTDDDFQGYSVPNIKGRVPKMDGLQSFMADEAQELATTNSPTTIYKNELEIVRAVLPRRLREYIIRN